MDAVIETLCERFHTTASALIETMARYYKMEALFGLIVSAVIFAISSAGLWLVLRNEKRKVDAKDEWYSWFDDGWALLLTTIFGLAAFVAFIFIIFDARCAALISIDPEAYTISQIINALK